jgi:uncharacterized protein (TIGR02594 family)
MTLPAQYAWLANETGPKMIVEGLKLFGTVETPGAKDNPIIMSWARELGLTDIYSHDAIPWCGLYMAIVAKRSAKPVVEKPLWALSWAKFGVEAKQPMLSDVLTFARDGGGHVAIYVGEDSKAYHCLGGNQSDKVCITRILKARLYRARRPNYNVRPPNVRRVMLSATGEISRNEA